MGQAIKILLILFISFLSLNNLSAQINLNPNKKFKPSLEDSLHREIDNDIYYTYYSPYSSEYRSSHKEPVFTLLKIDIGWDGKVTDIRFSDSADSAFVNAYFNNSRANNRKAVFEQYAKMKLHSRVSLLIPISYQPNYPNQKKVFSYDELEAMTKFNKQNFTGSCVMFAPINIAIAAKNEM